MENLNDMGICQICTKLGLYSNFYKRDSTNISFIQYHNNNKTIVCNKEIECGFLIGYYDARNVCNLLIVPNHCQRVFFFT